MKRGGTRVVRSFSVVVSVVAALLVGPLAWTTAGANPTSSGHTSAAAPGVSSPTASGSGTPAWHRVAFSWTSHKVAEFPYHANCTGTWAEGSGSCSANEIDSAGVDPSWGTTPLMQWNPRPGGGIDFTISGNGNTVTGHMEGRNRAEFYVDSANVPSWKPVGPVTGGTTGKTGETDGPLYMDVYNHSGYAYRIRLYGYLLFARTLTTFHATGSVRYGTPGQPVTDHPFDATLQVPDVPDACSGTYPNGSGSCTGQFSDESTVPFRGAGGSIRWFNTNGVLNVQLNGPPRSGAVLAGSVHHPSEWTVYQGVVPEWNAVTQVTAPLTAPLALTNTPG